VSKFTVFRTCAEIPAQVEVSRAHPLDYPTFPSVSVDATHVKARADHHIISRTVVVVATRVATHGNRILPNLMVRYI